MIGPALDSEVEAEVFAERAAVAEFDAGMSREDAEAAAREYVERYRHECEVRWCCAHASRVREYVEEVRKKRGDESADRLQRDARDQYRRGNRGRPYEWL